MIVIVLDRKRPLITLAILSSRWTIAQYFSRFHEQLCIHCATCLQAKQLLFDLGWFSKKNVRLKGGCVSRVCPSTARSRMQAFLVAAQNTLACFSASSPPPTVTRCGLCYWLQHVCIDSDHLATKSATSCSRTPPGKSLWQMNTRPVFLLFPSLMALPIQTHNLSPLSYLISF